jgi:hypothetical protein
LNPRLRLSFGEQVSPAVLVASRLMALPSGAGRRR